MDALKRIEIEQACRRLSIEYAMTIDSGRFDDFLDLWTEDGVWALPGGAPMQGRAAMQGYFTKRDPKTRSRHVVTNVVIDVIDDRTARGRHYATVYRHVGDERVAPLVGPTGVADYSDEFRLTPKGWKFFRRDIVMSFAR